MFSKDFLRAVRVAVPQSRELRAAASYAPRAGRMPMHFTSASSVAPSPGDVSPSGVMAAAVGTSESPISSSPGVGASKFRVRVVPSSPRTLKVTSLHRVPLAGGKARPSRMSRLGPSEQSLHSTHFPTSSYPNTNFEPS